MGQVGSSWHKWVKWNIYVGQVGQEQGGLQIDVEQVGQEQGVCPAEPLHLTQSGTARPWKIVAASDFGLAAVIVVLKIWHFVIFDPTMQDSHFDCCTQRLHFIEAHLLYPKNSWVTRKLGSKMIYA